MKLLFIFLIFVLIQLVTLASTNPLPTNSSKENFLKFYEAELNLIAEDFCEKTKNLSEKLLQDKDINNSSLPEVKEFKIFLHDFLRDYPHFKRFKLQQPLLALFINTANLDHVNRAVKNQETDLKFKQKMKLYFSNILKEYEENYEKFIKQKCLAKIEDLKKQLNIEDLKEIPKFSEIIEKLKSCQDYKCFPTDLDSLIVALNVSKDILINYFETDFKKCIALLAIHMNNYGQALFKNEKFLQLSLHTRQNLTHDINDFRIKLENSNDIEKFAFLIMEKPNYPKKYYNCTNCPLEDRVILNEILNKLVTAKAETKFDTEKYAVMSNMSAKMMFVLWLGPEHISEETKSLLPFLSTGI